MTPDDLKARTKKFAVDVIRFAKTIPKDPSTMRSRADFIHKLSGAVEEVDESALWLEILTEADISPRNQTKPLWIEADELTRILVRSRETARARRDRALGREINNQESTINNESSFPNQRSKMILIWSSLMTLRRRACGRS